MCFSATASFTAAAVLGGAGMLAWRLAQGAFTALGAFVSVWLLWWTTTGGVRAQAVGQHIAYTSVQPLATASTVLYVAATGLALVCSSHQFVRLFGGLTLVSMALAKLAYDTWFVSIWCFFAAALSVVVCLHLLPARRRFDAASA